MDGSSFDEGVAITFSITGVDVDDSIAWESSRGGHIGDGASVDGSGLAGGSHVITVTVTHEDDSSESLQSTVEVLSPPSVLLGSPTADGVYSGILPITWFTADANIGDDVYVDVFYSENGGLSWHFLARDLPGSGTLPWDTSEEADGTAYRLRILADDGRFTTSYETPFTFTIANNDDEAPLPAILSPVEGTHVFEGESVLFDASGSVDMDDDPMSFTWWSSLDGELGTGMYLYEVLTPGEHIITLTVTDGISMVLAYTTLEVIDVDPAPYLSGGTVVIDGMNATFQVDFTDPEDQNGVVTLVLDGDIHEMTPSGPGQVHGDGAPTVVTYTTTIEMAPGDDHYFAFRGYDEAGIAAQGDTGYHHGPAIDALDDRTPHLHSGSVQPSSGTISTSFLFSVHLTDPDGDVPDEVYLELDGDIIALSADPISSEAPGVPNGTMVYSIPLSLDPGSHGFRFGATSGELSSITLQQGGPHVSRPPEMGDTFPETLHMREGSRNVLLADLMDHVTSYTGVGTFTITALDDPEHVVLRMDGTRLLGSAPAGEWTGSTSTIIVFTDPQGETITLPSIEITVDPENDPPLVYLSRNLILTEDIPYLMGLSERVLDPEGGVVFVEIESYSVDLLHEPEVAGMTILLTPLADAYGFGYLTVKVTDDLGAWTTFTVSVVVNPVADPPRFVQDIMQIEVVQGETFILDPNGYIVTEGNDVACVSPSGRFTYGGTTGSFQRTFVLDDCSGHIHDSMKVQVDVYQPNSAPVISSLPQSVHVLEGGFVTLPFYITDDGSGPVSVTEDLDFTSIIPTGSEYLLEVRPGAGHVGDSILTVTALDEDGGTSTRTLAIRVGNTEQGPVFISNPIIQGREGVDYLYDADAVDFDLGTLSYRIIDAPAGMWISPNSGVIRYHPGEPGRVFVSIEVTDGIFRTIQSFFITFAEQNDPPKAWIDGPDLGLHLETLRFDGGKSTDEEGPVTLEWAIGLEDQGSTSPLTILGNDEVLGLTLPEGRYRLRLTVEDTGGKTSVIERSVLILPRDAFVISTPATVQGTDGGTNISVQLVSRLDVPVPFTVHLLGVDGGSYSGIILPDQGVTEVQLALGEVQGTTEGTLEVTFLPESSRPMDEVRSADFLVWNEEDILTPAFIGGGLLIAIGTVVAFSSFGGAMGIERGRVPIMGLFVPLYSKLKRAEILDHVVREQVYKYIDSHPGAHFSRILKELGTSNGTLLYHLSTLEREDIITSRKDGVYKRYYPAGRPVPKKPIEDLSWFQLRILDIIRHNYAITQKELSQAVGESRQVINYHIKVLRTNELIRVEREGKNSHCFVTKQVMEWERQRAHGEAEVDEWVVF